MVFPKENQVMSLSYVSNLVSKDTPPLRAFSENEMCFGDPLFMGKQYANQKFASFVRKHTCAKGSVKTEDKNERGTSNSYMNAILGKKTPKSSVSLIRDGGVLKFRMQKRNLKVLNMHVTESEIEISIGDEEDIVIEEF